MLLMIDNYDSFTYNLVQYLGELGEDVLTVRNDAITLDDIERVEVVKGAGSALYGADALADELLAARRRGDAVGHGAREGFEIRRPQRGAVQVERR